VKGRDAWLLGTVVVLALLVWAGTSYLERLITEWRSVHAEVGRLEELGSKMRAIEVDLASYRVAEERLEALHAQADALLLGVPDQHPCLQEHLQD
jgi:hypothetical protein